MLRITGTGIINAGIFRPHNLNEYMETQGGEGLKLFVSCHSHLMMALIVFVLLFVGIKKLFSVLEYRLPFGSLGEGLECVGTPVNQSAETGELFVVN